MSIIKYANEVRIQLDPNGIFVVEDNDSRKLLGYCAAVNLSNELAYIGGYCVRPEYRGHGIGKDLWNTGMAHMGDRNIAIFALNYKMFEIYRDLQNFNCIPDRRILNMRGQLNPSKDLIDTIDGISLVSVNENNIRDVIEYDKQIPENIHLVAINDRKEVVGYCFVVEMCSGITGIAPLYADNQQIAELLANKCCQRLPPHKTTDVLLKCWHLNEGAIELAKKLGLNEVGQQMTAFSKNIIHINTDKIYSLSSSSYHL
ncbi:unnamed protein product [Medioppia subpectinata]|uniref:N-acetyltransferase domain-containing protein n=1 Tax=Medioppia subpectinata TaxID=1979941 RepID=A0A7R9KZ33_9ACAR|nr:unnamed protein product [Medioppia subpectinata]CAG2112225.1 unnamed protein product [Medioppia subpectinata]